MLVQSSTKRQPNLKGRVKREREFKQAPTLKIYFRKTDQHYKDRKVQNSHILRSKRDFGKLQTSDR